MYRAIFSLNDVVNTLILCIWLKLKQELATFVSVSIPLACNLLKMVQYTPVPQIFYWSEYRLLNSFSG